jgi:hypothetical protein
MMSRCEFSLNSSFTFPNLRTVGAAIHGAVL